MHPCCGKDLRSVTKLAAVIDIVWTSVFIAGAIVIIVTTAMHKVIHPDSRASFDATQAGNGGGGEEVKFALGGIIVGTIILVVKILQLIMALFLLQGARERNHYKCKIWIYITCVFVIITIMNFVFDIVSVEGSNVGGYMSIIGITLHIYLLWIVWAFKQELEAGLAKPEAEADAELKQPKA